MAEWEKLKVNVVTQFNYINKRTLPLSQQGIAQRKYAYGRLCLCACVRGSDGWKCDAKYSMEYGKTLKP